MILSTKKKNERFLLIVAVAGLAFMVFLALVAIAHADIYSRGDIDSSSNPDARAYRTYELGTGISGTLTQAKFYGQTDGTAHREIKLYERSTQWTSGAMETGATYKGYLNNSSAPDYGDYSGYGTDVGLSIAFDPAKWYYLDYQDYGWYVDGWNSDAYLGHGWYNRNDHSISYTTAYGVYDPKFVLIGITSPDFPTTETDSATIEITAPTSTTTLDQNYIDTSYHVQTVEGGSYKIELLFEHQGVQTFYIPLVWGISSAGADEYDIQYSIGNLSNGVYTNFHANLYQNNTLVASDESSAEITLTGATTTGFGAGTYYHGSSTQYYAEHLPTFFSDNGLDEPSDFYTQLTGYVDSILNTVYGITGSFQSFFSDETARTYGQTVNSAILTVWGYVNDADELFGGYPFAFTIFMYLLIMISMLVIKMVKTVLLR